jgi:hypothetical protein
MVQRTNTNTTNPGIDYALTIIEANTSDAYTPPVIDVDAKTTMDGMGNPAITYWFEFDMRSLSHSFSQFDLIDCVIAPKQGTPHTFTAEVVHAGPDVVRVESYLQDTNNPIGDTLDDADDWESTQYDDKDPVPTANVNDDKLTMEVVDYHVPDKPFSVGDIVTTIRITSVDDDE